MKKEVKDTIITDLGEMLKQYPHFYVVDLTGLNAKDTSDLRRKCFKNEIKLVMVKNKLFIKALDAAEVDFSEMYPVLKGTSALMFTDVANKPAKMLKEYKDVNPTLKAAYAEEMLFVGAENLEALAAIKSKNEVIADIVALLQSPAKNVISALQGSAGGKIHGLLQTMSEKAE
ncbi:MAG: 50S ribosomal protein L10 [Prevotella sp.]|nr:50S ribosomal protein L10 [Prevotella sp.]